MTDGVFSDISEKIISFITVNPGASVKTIAVFLGRADTGRSGTDHITYGIVRSLYDEGKIRCENRRYYPLEVKIEKAKSPAKKIVSRRNNNFQVLFDEEPSNRNPYDANKPRFTGLGEWVEVYTHTHITRIYASGLCAQRENPKALGTTNNSKE